MLPLLLLLLFLGVSPQRGVACALACSLFAMSTDDLLTLAKDANGSRNVIVRHCSCHHNLLLLLLLLLLVSSHHHFLVRCCCRLYCAGGGDYQPA